MENRSKYLLILAFLLSTVWSTAQVSEQLGIASYYDDAFHGKKTASKEIYNKTKFTAAHKEYPFGTNIRVTRLDNKKSVVVKVNDRGPYIKGRIVDLSKAAAERLGMLSDGQAKVKIEVVDDSSAEQSEQKITPPPVVEEVLTPKKVDVVAPAKPTPKPKPKPAAPKATPKAYDNTKPKTKPVTKSKYRSVTAGNYSDFDLYKIELKRPEKIGYGVQIASFKEYNNALRHIAELEDKSFDNVLLSIEKGTLGETLYKVILGPFDNRDSANNYKKSAKKRYKMNGFVVDLSKLNYD